MMSTRQDSDRSASQSSHPGAKPVIEYLRMTPHLWKLQALIKQGQDHIK
jgi:hypothetical protein